MLATLVDIPDSSGGLTSLAQAQHRLNPAVVRPRMANSAYEAVGGMVMPESRISQMTR